jgi:hypothetical protein
LLGFSKQDDRPATRLFARLFGVRELLLAALVLRAGDDKRELARIALLQAAVDAGDAASLVVPLARRQGLGRPVALMLVPALTAVPLWLRHARVDAQPQAATGRGASPDD